MEENLNLSAERSLEIITQQIEQNRRVVSKDVGKCMSVAGMLTMTIVILVTIVIYVTETPLGHLLWFLLPLLIWLKLKKYNKQQSIPANFIGMLIGKTWWTFAVFVLTFYLFAIVYNFFITRLFSPTEAGVLHMRFFPIIPLLMGMCITITGHILRSKWLVLFGIIAGLGAFIFEWLNIGGKLLMFLSSDSLSNYAVSSACLPCLTILIFAFLGLYLPGELLQKHNKL